MFLHEPARCFPQGKPPGLPQESRRRPEKGRSACAAGTMQSSKPDMSQAAFLWGRTGVWGEGQRQRTPIPSISFSSFSSSQLSGGPRSPSRLWPAGVTLLLQTSPLPASLPPCRGARSKRGDFRFRETNNQKNKGKARRAPQAAQHRPLCSHFYTGHPARLQGSHRPDAGCWLGFTSFH